MMGVVHRLLLVLTLLAGLTSHAAAQTNLHNDLRVWERLATKVEGFVSDPDVDTQTLRDMRGQVVTFRDEFDEARQRNAARIAALRDQIAALGPPPDENSTQTEPPEVSENRQNLTETLNDLLSPVQQAEVAYVRANSLVSQIDGRFRNDQTEKLLSMQPSPLMPGNWIVALADLRSAVDELAHEVGTGTETGGNMRQNLPLVVVLAVIGFVLILRGRRWSTQMVSWLRNHEARGFVVWQFVASLLRVGLPMAGIAMLLWAAKTTGLLGPRLNTLAELLASLLALMLSFRWVSERVFNRDDDIALIPLPRDQRKRARYFVALLTIAVVLSGLVQGVLRTGMTEPATLPVVAFPFFVTISILLFCLGRLLRSYRDVKEPPEADAVARSSSLSRFVRGLGTGALIVACVSPALMALGYFDLATAIQRPYVLSLALLGAVLALQRFLADVYSVVTGQGVAARDALLPVIFGMVLVLLVVPLLALIWGAQLTDLSELWTAFSRGFSIGDSQISLTDLIYFLIIFAVGYLVTRLVQSTLRTNVLPKTKIDIGGQNAIVSGLGYIGIFIAALLAITGAGIDLSSIAIVAGALSVGIGFGLQNIVNNFVSGIILLIERPISEGDWIEVGGQMGYVRDISVRSTRIETFDRTDVIVPNGDLVTGTVTNYTRGNTVGRVIVPVGVAYGTDTRRVETILREIADAQPMVLASPPPSIVFNNFGADSLEFEVRVFLRDVNWYMQVKNDINHAIAARFAEEKIEIPFAQRDLWLRNPEALRQLMGQGPTETS